MTAPHRLAGRGARTRQRDRRMRRRLWALVRACAEIDRRPLRTAPEPYTPPPDRRRPQLTGDPAWWPFRKFLWLPLPTPGRGSVDIFASKLRPDPRWLPRRWGPSRVRAGKE